MEPQNAELVIMEDEQEKKVIGRLKDVDDFVDFFQSLHFSPPIRYLVRKMIADGSFDRWLRKIGEIALAELLKDFEKAPLSLYGEAAEIFQDNACAKKKSFADVVGYPEVKKRLLERAIYPAKFEKISRAYGRRTNGGILLYGPPGCGKTHIAGAIAGESSKKFVERRLGELVRQDNLTIAFRVTKMLKGAIFFIDEMEILAIDRDAEGMSSRFTPNDMLCEMGKIKESQELIFIGATNCPWMVDSAITRSGRMDELIYVGVPDLGTRLQLLRFYSRELPLGEVDFESIANKTAFYSCSDMEEICCEAAAIPWREAVAGGAQRAVGQKDFETALENTPSTAIAWFEGASKMAFPESVTERYAPMMKEINRFKQWRDERKKTSEKARQYA